MFTSAADHPDWENYPHALRDMGMRVDAGRDGQVGLLDVLRIRFPAVSNTIVITVLCILGQVISSSLVGFGFARFNFRGRPFLFVLMLSTMMLPYQVTMIPVFVMFRWAGLIDTFWPLILPQWFASPFFAFMFRQFFAQVPEELMEAARIDGAGNWTIYWRMMLPLSGPVIAIVAIFTFMTTWNDFLAPLIYLNSPENRTLALALNAFNGQYGINSANLLMAASFVAMFPCIVLFFAAQRYFVDSAATTGLKA
jgi:multiple sugar transport system permease protein